MDTMPAEDVAALNEAAALVLSEIRANPDAAVRLLMEAFFMCGTAAADQGRAAVLAERAACAAAVHDVWRAHVGEAAGALAEAEAAILARSNERKGCARSLDCGGECFLLAGHPPPCKCPGDGESPGSCPA